jgi:hypothetical protein
VADYFTIESARDQILRIGHIEKEFAPQSFPDDWQFCPCPIGVKGFCNNPRCPTPIILPIWVNEPHLGQFPIEIIYIKNRGGFIRADNTRLKNFINAGRIDRNALTVVSF